MISDSGKFAEPTRTVPPEPEPPEPCPPPSEESGSPPQAASRGAPASRPITARRRTSRFGAADGFAPARGFKVWSVAAMAAVLSWVSRGPSARVESVYGVPADRMEFTPISDGGGPLTVKALKDGDVDLANIFSTTPAIEENGFVMLEDPEGMVTPQNIVPLMAKDRVTDQIREAVESVQKVLTTEDLMAMNAENSGEQKKQPREVAGEWLKEKGLV